ncbi:SPOR domain-containing protein [Paraburkholderia dinghuensis]|uniref:SPOR domain-containing protein n=1 Tax=Paraburkholderia dinghuensis TaxID=2305225 RepID=A0A3N6MP24_9BURK|nr:SPOR domain-containing protein [Paraburkholderia dinghuensis]RQH05664.1 SPOR domain-containing protein [Paraburkholderia dinghuensis]
MGLFSFGKKDDTAPRRRGAEAGSERRSSQGTRVERRSRRPDRSSDAEAMLLDPTLPEKQRARRRLVGAIALVVAAIVILPMVLDSHPRPVTDDIAIDIPSRPSATAGGPAARDDAADTQAGVAPDNPGASDLSAAAVPGASAIASAAPAAPTQSAQNSVSTPATAASATSGKTTQTAQTQSQPQPSPTSKPPAQPSANTAAAAVASRNAHADATSQSSPQGQKGVSSADNTIAAPGSTAPATPPGARYAVQLGAFSNEATARNWVTKLKAAGVPAYTEQRKQADGSTRTLLRAGPFADRAAASEAIAKVRGAGLMAGSNGAAE